MAGRWAGISDRIHIAPQSWGLGLGPVCPLGVTTGRWVALGPMWVRLGSRNSWQDEDMDAEMITPVKPPPTRKHET
jgi:hypothetical protein